MGSAMEAYFTCLDIPDSIPTIRKMVDLLLVQPIGNNILTAQSLVPAHSETIPVASTNNIGIETEREEVVVEAMENDTPTNTNHSKKKPSKKRNVEPSAVEVTKSSKKRSKKTAGGTPSTKQKRAITIQDMDFDEVVPIDEDDATKDCLVYLRGCGPSPGRVRGYNESSDTVIVEYCRCLELDYTPERHELWLSMLNSTHSQHPKEPLELLMKEADENIKQPPIVFANFDVVDSRKVKLIQGDADLIAKHRNLSQDLKRLWGLSVHEYDHYPLTIDKINDKYSSIITADLEANYIRFDTFIKQVGLMHDCTGLQVVFIDYIRNIDFDRVRVYDKAIEGWKYDTRVILRTAQIAGYHYMPLLGSFGLFLKVEDILDRHHIFTHNTVFVHTDISTALIMQAASADGDDDTDDNGMLRYIFAKSN